MKLIISGSRSITQYHHLIEALSASPYTTIRLTEIVSGNAQGADMLGEKYAKAQGIPLVLFPARWDELGPGAGIKRNKEMAAYADALLCCWDKVSRGSSSMIDIMRRAGKPYFVYCPDGMVTFSGNLQHLALYQPQDHTLTLEQKPGI